ncbi:hypothetical protein AB5J49_08255 [Streptomyces sp. R28]|uniref:Uncharacterized protein n=1 Tax=Streptomyces sp. R28 TaxID=3238628 RepID=A0AB39PRE5_9ACTN
MSARLSPEQLADYAALDFAELMPADAAAVVARMRDALVGELAAVRSALREASDQVAELESELAGAVVVSETLHRRLSDEQLAGSALYAALTMPTTPEQLQAALDQFTAVARKVTGEAVAR